MKRSNRISLMMVLAGSLFAASCGDDGGGILDGPAEELLRQCGIDVDCEQGLLQGNASISGVASIDAFFSSVLSFQGKADGVSAAIEAELNAIRADFGVAANADLSAEIEAQIAANVEGSLKVEAEPARCAVDAEASLQAQANCDAEFDPGSAMVMCEGSCEVEASANVECSAGAELKCTVTAPSVECSGECKGSCEVEIEGSASCDGTCTGTCSGECSAYSDSGATQCAGQCDGMCTGSCKSDLAVAAECSGKCSGECTATPPDGNCEGGIRAECEAMAGAMVECKGKCEGNFEPPMAKAECNASAKAEAKLNVECTPPRLAINYKLKAGASVDVEAQARFVAAVENLKVRLPALLAALGKAELIVDAGEGLVADASGALDAGIDAAGEAAASGNLRITQGLVCATGQIDVVADVIGDSSARLEGNVSAVASLKGALGV